MPPNQLKDLHLLCILILSFKLRCFGWFIYLEVLFDWCDWAHARTNQLSPFNAPQTHTHTQQFCAKHWDPGHLLSVASDNEKFCTRKHIKINFFGQSFRRKNETEKENMERERRRETKHTYRTEFKLFCVCAAQRKSENWKNLNWIISILAKRKTFQIRYRATERIESLRFVNVFLVFGCETEKRGWERWASYNMTRSVWYRSKWDGEKELPGKQQEFSLREHKSYTREPKKNQQHYVWRKGNPGTRTEYVHHGKILLGEWYTILNWHDTLFFYFLEKKCLSSSKKSHTEVNNEWKEKHKKQTNTHRKEMYWMHPL